MNPNIWSLQLCRDVFGMTGNAADNREMCEIRFFGSETDLPFRLSAEVTRVIGPQHGLDIIDPISFAVESTREQSGNSRYFFIKFDEDQRPVQGSSSSISMRCKASHVEQICRNCMVRL
jgi:hypothetical protein